MGKYSAARDLNLTSNIRWYLVANRAEARIYRDRPKHRFEFLERIENPEGKLTETQLDSDRPGRGFSSARGGIISHSLDKTSVKHEGVAKRFAAQLARILEAGVYSNKLNELVIVAEPHFLGLLRAEIPAKVKNCVELEINREFAQGSDPELRDYIEFKLQEARASA